MVEGFSKGALGGFFIGFYICRVPFRGLGLVLGF